MKLVALLAALLFVGCGMPAPDVAPGPESCKAGGDVTVHVVNRSFSDIRVNFGPVTKLQAATANGTTTYEGIPRAAVRGWISWTIARGGLQVGRIDPVAGTNPMCGVATLLILPNGRAGIFYGADVRGRGGR